MSRSGKVLGCAAVRQIYKILTAVGVNVNVSLCMKKS